MNTPSTVVLENTEDPPQLSPQDEREIDALLTVHAASTPLQSVSLVTSTMDRPVGVAEQLGIDMRASIAANREKVEAGIDLFALLTAEKKQTHVSLHKVIQLKQGMIEREARATREALQSSPADVDELMRQLLVVKLTTNKISDDCYKKLKHMLRGMRNASKYKMPL